MAKRKGTNGTPQLKVKTASHCSARASSYQSVPPPPKDLPAVPA
eukprot:CAMPEP_0183370656 /NCGR_PEP_ID=MMETSP0164_2-20130417/103095_1 /TAXON_ID=221442 /ORGANISM="Coccolithus pelagicus ssp braarudi, Strain PLY182g" /LENGTH=43 /DNA_ID= /DNA_START= /DNA_END= /DNA_ORIENTATION=